VAQNEVKKSNDMSCAEKPISTRLMLMTLWKYLSSHKKAMLGLLGLLMLASGIGELISLGATVPFLVALSSPDTLWDVEIVKRIAMGVGINEPNDLVIPATLIFILAAFLSALVRISNVWVNVNLAASIGSDLSSEAYLRTLYQPYSQHANSKSSNAIAGITVSIRRTIQVILGCLQICSASIVAAGICLGLLYINWKVATAAILLFGSFYLVLSVSTRNEIRINGQVVAELDRLLLKTIQEGLGAIRDVILEGSQQIYADKYRGQDARSRKLEAKNVFLGLSPRFTLEALGIVGIGGLGCLMTLKSSGLVIPVLGAMALGAQRLLPALQQIYGSWTTVKGFSADVGNVITLLEQPLPEKLETSQLIKFEKSIKLENIEFQYSSDTPIILKGLNLEIKKGERIGIVGGTGSGKSTTVDMLMGLLEPSSGKILIDDVDILGKHQTDYLIAWRGLIAHVPQTIFLSDGSILDNIAFVGNRESIDIERVWRCADQAQLKGFLEGLPNGIETLVGERGVKLSGGQRQRIGIARALYKRSEVLVLDEATSALDSSTEEAVMNAIESLSDQLTMIMIAHRTSTLRGCDRIIEINAGVVENERSPQNE